MQRRPILYITACLLLALVMILPSCTNDKLNPPMEVENCEPDDFTFDKNISAIITQYCAYDSSCHLDQPAIGDFQTYAGMLNSLENGKFEERAFELRDMPPSYANGPKELAEADLDALVCWIANGHPEN